MAKVVQSLSNTPERGSSVPERGSSVPEPGSSVPEPGGSISAPREALVVTAPLTDRSTATARPGSTGRGGRALTPRAVVLGMGMVAFVAAFTPYNDYVLHNSPFIGNHFPIGIVTLMTAMVLLVNPVLGRFRRRPFSPAELVVMMTMMLVGAAVPSSGLMRYFESMVLSPFTLARDFPWLRPIAEMMPGWLTPARDPASPTLLNFALGIDPVHGGRVPVAGFLLPSLVWGVLIAAVMGSSLFLAAIFRKQWVHHERLTYPLATIPLELLAAPEAGKSYNALWRNPILWAGAAIPFIVYFLSGLHSQFPGLPNIDLHFDVRAAFTDRPWDALPTHITESRLYFAAVGICFFIPSEVAFSLWLFVLVNGAARVFFARTSFDPGQQESTRDMGTYVAYFAGLLWLARGHLKHVMVSAWKNAPRAEEEALSYRAMVVGWMVCVAVAWGWLVAAGMQVVLAGLLLAVGTMLVILMARIVAETGLFYVNVAFWPKDLFNALVAKTLVTTKNFYWTEMVSGIFYGDFRENLMPYAANSLRMGQELKGNGGAEKPKWFMWMAGALLLSTVVSGGMNHYLSYTRGRAAIEDARATTIVPDMALRETYSHENSAAETTLQTAWGHFGIGGVMAGTLMAGRILWAGWPFHPIGLILMDSSAMKVLWFSIFIGWGTKRLLLRYGGAGAFRRARPFFIGLIVGETLAAGVWMFVGLATQGGVRYTLLPL